ncbi:hypothetical protein FC682_10990 [Peribacillus simplex]|nr:hypothetical protein FC682_10990 [Peribacillus simplex]
MCMKVHIIAPYESMIPIIKACVPLYPDLEIGYSKGDLENGVELAKLEAENGADAIISRGGTAKLIKLPKPKQRRLWYKPSCRGKWLIWKW